MQIVYYVGESPYPVTLSAQEDLAGPYLVELTKRNDVHDIQVDGMPLEEFIASLV